MEISNLLNESAQGFKNLQADAARLADKWTATGLLEGLSNEIEKNSMAMILENQAKQLVSEVYFLVVTQLLEALLQQVLVSSGLV